MQFRSESAIALFCFSGCFIQCCDRNICNLCYQIVIFLAHCGSILRKGVDETCRTRLSGAVFARGANLLVCS